MRKTTIIAVALVAIVVLVFGAVQIKGHYEEKKIVEEMGASAGLEDSVFDDSNESEEQSGDTTTEESKPEDTKSENTTSDNSSNEDKDTGNGNNGGNSTPSKGEMDYETFRNMTPSEQRAFVESFKDEEAFFKWYNKAKNKYEKENPAVEIGNGPVELE